MSKAYPPELKIFIDKELSLKLNGGGYVQGILPGFDPPMSLVIEECVEMETMAPDLWDGDNMRK